MLGRVSRRSGVVVSLIAIGSLLSSVCVWTYRAQTQRRAVATLQEANIEVYYSEFPSPNCRWLLNLGLGSVLGTDYFFPADFVCICRGDVTLGPEVFTAVMQLRELRAVEIGPCNVNPELARGLLASVSECHSIEKLMINSINFGVPISGLEKLTNLRVLHVTGVESDLVTMKCIGAVKSLVELSLNDSPLTTEGLRQLNGLTHLRGLRIDETRVNEIPIECKEMFGGLEFLNISGTWIDDPGMTRLEFCKSLKTLYADFGGLSSGPTVGPQGLSAIGKLEMLELLSLVGQATTDKYPVLHLPRLKVLKLDSGEPRTGIPLSQAWLDSIATMSTLEELWCHHAVIDDDGFIILSRLPRLRVLQCNVKISDSAAASISRMRNLQLISICGLDSLPKSTFEALARLPSLKTVYIEGGDDKIQMLRSRLPEANIHSQWLDGHGYTAMLFNGYSRDVNERNH